MLFRPAVGLLVALTALGALAPSASAAPPLAAAPPLIAAAAAAAAPGAAGRDYATDVFGDPMDYSNRDDMLLDPGPTADLANARMEGGAVRGTVRSAGYLSPVWAGYQESVLLGRDGALAHNQLNADRYRTVAFQAYSSRDVAAGLMWFNCPGGGLRDTCGGGQPFTLRAGWHTYQLTPGASVYPGWPLAWRGSLTGLRLAVSPGSAGADIALDWFRVVQPGSGAEHRWTNPDGGSAQILWDSDAANDNNTSSQSGWGVLTSSSASSGTVDLSGLPAGTYRIGVRTSRSTQWASATLDAPLPEVLTPNAVGDRDFATDVLGNPWDMNGADDVVFIGNAGNVSYSGGRLWATNRTDDPFVAFATGARGIDSRLYRNVTITSGYEGGFDLSGNPGGGTMARVVWARPGAGHPGSTNDILTYSGTRTITADLGAPDNPLLEPETQNNYSFASASPASAFRWDPNEDPGARRWYVDDVQLRSDFATRTTFPITWQDNAFRSGGTARIVADTDRTGCNGVTVTGGTPVAQGVNTTTWNTAGVPAGRYWLCLTITRGNSSTSAYAGGVLVVGSDPAPRPAPVGRSPIGSVDTGGLSGTTWSLAGWALDQDDPSRSIAVDVYDLRPDGTRVGTRITADRSRGDIAAAYPGAEAQHGFATSLRLAGAGRHEVCVFAINVGGGGNTLLNCRVVDVPGPVGSVDRAASDAVGTISVSGWAADPDAPATAQDVHVYVTGPAGSRGTALRTGQTRDDVARTVPFAGSRSGWQGSVPAMGEGVNQVCAFAINVNPPRTNPLIGCRSVTVRNDFGALDAVSVNGATATASGWAINPNRPGEAAPIHVYDYGPSGARGYSGFTAGQNRPDLAGFGFGTAHGYSASIPLTGAGRHTVCTFAITTGGGTGNTLLGCREVTVR